VSTTVIFSHIYLAYRTNGENSRTYAKMLRWSVYLLSVCLSVTYVLWLNGAF